MDFAEVSVEPTRETPTENDVGKFDRHATWIAEGHTGRGEMKDRLDRTGAVNYKDAKTIACGIRHIVGA